MNNQILPYPLVKEEIDKLDDYWKFISIFNDLAIKSFSVFDFRKNIIKIIKKKYSADEFYFYETILNKLLWNLMKIYGVNVYKNRDDSQINYAFDIMNNSCINKQIMIYKNYQVIFPYYKIFLSMIDKNKNLKILNKILYVIKKKELYYKVIANKEYINKIVIKEDPNEDFYYPPDYPFPNVNLVSYNNSDKKQWIKRIKAYYYSKGDSNWYKLIV